MEADRRPSKLRKVSHGTPDDEMAPPRHLPSLNPEMSIDNVSVVASPENPSKTILDSTADSADTQIDASDDSEEHADLSTPTANCYVPDTPRSKNQLKKLRKKQEWEAGRDYRKARRKDKIAERKAKKREARGHVAGLGVADDKLPSLTTAKTPRPRSHTRLPITFLIDCGFDDLMTEKERISLGSQVTRAYSDNHRAPFQAHLMVSSWGGLLKERFDTVLDKHYENWKGVTFVTENFVKAAETAKDVMKSKHGGKLEGIFSPPPIGLIGSPGTLDAQKRPNASSEVDIIAVLESETQQQGEPPTEHSQTSRALLDGMDGGRGPDLPAGGSREAIEPSPTHTAVEEGEVIYLTSDSPNTLETLKPYSTYIIGGLVDKNRHKGICYKVACDENVKTAKLPIGEFMEMQSRFVLATNHVVEIMVKYLECGSWGGAFMQVIPKRKGGKLKNGEEAMDSLAGAEDESEDNSGRILMNRHGMNQQAADGSD